MNAITLRPAEPERDFGQISAWFALLEDDPLLAGKLKASFVKTKALVIMKVL